MTTVAYGDKRYPEPGMCIGMCCFINDDNVSNTEHEESKESFENLCVKIDKCIDRLDKRSKNILRLYNNLDKMIEIIINTYNNMENRKDET